MKIRDTKLNCDDFEGRSMALNTFYKIYLQSVETGYLEIFAKYCKPMRFLVK